MDLYGRGTALTTLLMRVCVACLAGLALAVVAASGATGATVAGPCSIQAVGTVSGSADLGKGGEWHLRRDEAVTVRVLAPQPQTHLDATVAVFGVAAALPRTELPRYTTYLQGPDQVATWSRFSRAAAVSVRTDACSSSLVAVVDDQNPVLTLAGGIGAAVGALALMGLVLLAFRPRRVPLNVAGGLLGLLAGVGVRLFLQQLLWLDPRSYVTLAPPILGLFGGVGVPGLLRPALRSPASQ